MWLMGPSLPCDAWGGRGVSSPARHSADRPGVGTNASQRWWRFLPFGRSPNNSEQPVTLRPDQVLSRITPESRPVLTRVLARPTRRRGTGVRGHARSGDWLVSDRVLTRAEERRVGKEGGS